MRTARFGLLALILAAPRRLPADPATAPPRGRERAPTPATHVVRPGQSLFKIASDYKVSLERLCRANGILASKPIRPGKKLVIPDSPASAPAAAKPERAAAKTESATAAASAPPTSRPKSAKPAPERDPYVRRPKRRGYLILHSTVGRWEGVAVAPNGSIPDAARKGFSRVMASWRTGERQQMSDDLLRLLVRVSDRFGGRPMRVVSGFRPWSKTQYTPHSQHNLGRAVDFSIPGVPNEVVRDYCRTFSAAGVGYYPNSSFIHLDARGYASYWIDYSGPGKPPRYASGPAIQGLGGS